MAPGASAKLIQISSQISASLIVTTQGLAELLAAAHICAPCDAATFVNLNGGWVACNTHDATNNRNTHDAAPTLQQDVTQDAPHKMQKVATTRCSRGDATQELQQTVASLSDCGTGPGRASCDEARCMGSVTAYESDSRPCHGAQFCAKQ